MIGDIYTSYRKLNEKKLSKIAVALFALWREKADHQTLVVNKLVVDGVEWEFSESIELLLPNEQER